MKLTVKLLIIILFNIFLLNYSYAWINYTVSPIKYEIEAQTWSTITKTAKLINNSDKEALINTEKFNFTVVNNSGIPDFLSKNEEHPYPEQELVSWISIDTDSFIIWPNESKEITFTINVPSNATPGWHYWAVFFRDPNKDLNSWNWLWVNVDYWVLILVRVDWELISDWEVWDIKISWWWWGNNGWKEIKIDDCPLWDLSWNSFDWKCTDDETWDTIEINKSDDENNFNVTFEIPFKNKWNTHLKPNGKIILKDEDWNIIKNIWKEIISNDNWAVMGEIVVNYIPINDSGWNVLPYSDRDFLSEWKWFPYKDYDDDWNQIMNYWNPSEYYTKQNQDSAGFLMFWEKVKERKQNKKIKAIIDIAYEDSEWNLKEFNSAKEFNIEYKEKYIWINYYIVIPLIIFIFTVIFIPLFIILFKRLNKKYYCKKCEKVIKKEWDVCPHCLKKQKVKKK